MEEDARLEDGKEECAQLYGISRDSFKRLQKDSAYFYWLKLEKQELAKYISRLRKLYIDNDGEESTKPPLEPEETVNQPKLVASDKATIQVRVIVVEARGLLNKDEDGGSDPYVVLEYSDSRYQTEVVPHSLEPYWNQEVNL